MFKKLLLLSLTVILCFAMTLSAEWKSYKVAASSDDAEEHTDENDNYLGYMESLTSSDLELGHESGTNLQMVGIRFTGLDIPPGATINAAYIQFTCDDDNDEATTVAIWGEDADNSETFTRDDFNISLRDQTDAQVLWMDIPAWMVIGDRGTDQQTPDIAAIVQEIVDRPGYALGNPITIILNGLTGEREAESWDDNAEDDGNPELFVDFEAGGGEPPIQSENPFFPPGSVWKYLDDGSDQGTAWQALEFDDSGWAEGPGQLGFGEGDEATVITKGFITYYFRKKLTNVDPASLSNTVFSIIHDDGMLLHINGVEIARSELVPDGEVNYLTGMTTYIPNDVENSFFNYDVDPSAFQVGDNIIAIEVHQQNLGSSDVSFDCTFNGDYTPTAVEKADGFSPTEFLLSQNYPNPFNPSTTIGFDIVKAGRVTLSVFNIMGQHVATLVDQDLGTGHYTAEWATDTNVPGGIYFYKLSTGDGFQIRKMTLMK